MSVAILVSQILQSLWSFTPVDAANFKTLLQDESFEAKPSFMLQPVTLDNLGLVLASEIAADWNIQPPAQVKGGLADFRRRVKEITVAQPAKALSLATYCMKGSVDALAFAKQSTLLCGNLSLVSFSQNGLVAKAVVIGIPCW